ncbi:MAG: tRNA (guanosine(46)-N7)-methyltransferase TrmB [Gammaproteobacteria bacterium]|nr:tRNA (guanosine(46)-N7)-methyltransferase TrmB [Gammaproteobacteria bacterium]
MAEQPSRPPRQIRSYVLREGRLTPGQQRAFDLFWPRWGVEYGATSIDPAALYGNPQPLFVEIGFGNGESLAEMARRNPERNYLGIEVHRPGVGQLLRMLDEYGCENVRVMRHDAVEVLNGMLPPASVQGIYLFFPDPWHKKRHHKRRILSAAFVAELARVIKPGGFFHAATDWQDYAEQMMDVLSTTPAFVNRVGNRRYSERPDDRPLTKFERRGQRLGHGVWDLVFDRCE